MWKSIVKPEKLRFSSRIIKATIETHTNSYVLTIAFPLQQWLHEGNSLLRYTYIVVFKVNLLAPEFYIQVK
jgi:hypothetical protein